MAEFDRNGLEVRLGDGLAIMPSAANQKAVKHVLAKRLKLTATESVQVIYDATVQMHAKTKVPNLPVGGIQNMIDALHRVNLAKSRQRIWSIILSWNGWKSRVTSLNR